MKILMSLMMLQLFLLISKLCKSNSPGKCQSVYTD